MDRDQALKALSDLVNLVANDTLGPSVESDPDDESVGWGDNGPLPMTFGHVRRAIEALQVLREEAIT